MNDLDDLIKKMEGLSDKLSRSGYPADCATVRQATDVLRWHKVSLPKEEKNNDFEPMIFN